MKKIISETKLLLRDIPAIIVALFIVAIVIMNLLANKSVNLPVTWLALDVGFCVSWIASLTMDIITRRYGARAATLISFSTALVNLLIAGILYIASIIPGTWSQSYVPGSSAAINTALNNTFGGLWYVLLGSTIAFLTSSIVNNYVNEAVGRVSDHGNFKGFALRSYISTAVAQIVDNLLFALIVSHNFFGWTLLQCFTCAVTGAFFELLCEVIFSPIGYKISNAWKKENVGATYIATYVNNKEKEVA